VAFFIRIKEYPLKVLAHGILARLARNDEVIKRLAAGHPVFLPVDALPDVRFIKFKIAVAWYSRLVNGRYVSFAIYIKLIRCAFSCFQFTGWTFFFQVIIAYGHHVFERMRRELFYLTTFQFREKLFK